MAISPGYPVIEAGRWLYRRVYGQEPPDNRSTAWWLRWIGEVWVQPEHRDVRNAMREEGNLYFWVFSTINRRGLKLAVVEEQNPAYTQPEPDYGAIFVGKDSLGWSLPQSEWPEFISRAFGWLVKEILAGRIGTRYLDVALDLMVQRGAEKAALPVWTAPTEGSYPTDMESAVWVSYMRKSGWLNVQKRLLARQMEILQEKKRDSERWLSFLDTADKVVGWMSLTEPARILSRRADELTDQYARAKETIAKAKATLVQVPEAAAENPGLQQRLNQISRKIDDDAMPAFRLLNPAGLWDAEAPSQLGAAVQIVTVTSITLAVGVVSVCLANMMSNITSAERAAAEATRTASQIIKDRVQATQDAFERQKLELRQQLIMGEIDQASYDRTLLDINKQQDEALKRLQRDAQDVQDKAPTGTMASVFSGAGTVLLLGALGAGYLFRKQIGRRLGRKQA